MENKKELELIIEDLKEREIYSNCANIENFLSLKKDQRIVYLGIDCTAESLHIGHLLPIVQAFRLAKNEFKIIILLGGATSRIGDPSDKLKERPILEKKTILINQQKIESQIEKIFNKKEKRVDLSDLKSLPLKCFFGENKSLVNSIYKILNLNLNEECNVAWNKYLDNILPREIGKKNFEIVDNKNWLDKLSFVDFINSYGRNITINYLLAKETIKQRIGSENGISFSAFSYSLLQAYDFFHLYREYNCHGQLGSSDQWGNFTTGLKMIKSFDHDNKCFALSFNLMLDQNGKKISKSEKRTRIIWLDEKKTSFKDFFNHLSNLSDEKSIEYIKKFTFISKEQLENILVINEPKSLRILQRILIELFFFLIHGKEGLKWVQENCLGIRNK